jgi:hypothetical protein
MRHKKIRTLKFAHLLTWEKDKVSAPFVAWQSWQQPILDSWWLGWATTKG